MFPSGTPRRLQIDFVSVGCDDPPRMTRLRSAKQEMVAKNESKGCQVSGGAGGGGGDGKMK